MSSRKKVLVLDFGDSLTATPNPDDGKTVYGEARKMPPRSVHRWSVEAGPHSRLVDTKAEAKRLLREWAEAAVDAAAAPAAPAAGPGCWRCGTSGELCPDGLCASCSMKTVRVESSGGDAR